MSDYGYVATAVPTRKDTLALKTALADLLGDNGPLYWKRVKDYILARINRKEFEDAISHLFVRKRHGM